MVYTRWFRGNDDLQDAFAIRTKVFIQEQGVPEELEMDGSDKDAVLAVAYEDGVPVATGRIWIHEGQSIWGASRY